MFPAATRPLRWSGHPTGSFIDYRSFVLADTHNGLRRTATVALARWPLGTSTVILAARNLAPRFA